MRTFIKPMPSNTPVANAGDHVGDHAKLVDAINELRGSVPNAASEVNAAPSTILNTNGKVTDVALASVFVKTINSNSPDASGNINVTATGGYDGTDAVKTTGNQSVSGVKSFTSAPTIAVDAVNSTDAVRKSQLDLKANASTTVDTVNAQTIAGVKSFSSPPVSTTAATTGSQLVRKNELDLKADLSTLVNKANTSDVVTVTNDQTIAGVKTFSSPPVSATTATVDSQVINFGQAKSLVSGASGGSTMQIVSFGTTAGTARPSGVPNGGVYWVGTGTVLPTNALSADLVYLP